ncbi:MAG TPA: hypothetical protein VG054_03130 [Acidimicrobiales bacterium]|nr:hypothetical protein [Acidimicrobiales bacterium]
MWIVTGLVLGVVAYAGIVLMAVAGFTAVLPLVVIPPVLVALIGGNNLLGGGRSHGRSPGRPVGQGRAPLSSGPNGAVRPDTLPASSGQGGPATRGAEGPSGPP